MLAMPNPIVPDAVVALWQALLGVRVRQSAVAVAAWPGETGWREALTPALIDSLSPNAPHEAGPAREAQLYGRYQQALQLQALRWIAEAGVSCVAIKGFASAFLYYPVPAARLIGDLDLLVRSADLPTLVGALGVRGFRFGGVDGPAWGFLSDASFMPFHSPDGNCNIDLHVEPDSYPLHLGLGVEAVFERARQIVAGGQPVAVPCAEHLALIAVSNLAKDKFAPHGLRKLLDLGRLLAHESEFDWPALRAIASRAKLTRALATAVALLQALGTPEALLPSDMRLPRGAVFDDLLRDWLSPREPSLAQRLQREWFLAATPGVATTLAWRRLRGLFGGRSGLPDLATPPPP